MCGIIAYCGENAVEKILFGLKALEYRGYDSAGLAIENESGITCVKSVGKVVNLEKKVEKLELVGTVAIGHTRWATHGKVTEKNCHPQSSHKKSVYVVHNGIIENYLDLKAELIEKGVKFSGETDTEVIANLLAYYEESEKDPKKAIIKTAKRLVGSFAVAAIFASSCGKVYGFCEKSPLVFCETEDGPYLASDSIAIKSAKSVTYIEPSEIAEISVSGARLYDKDLARIGKRPEAVVSEEKECGLCGYSHYMEKEIFSEPEALSATFAEYEKRGMSLEAFSLSDFELSKVSRIYAVACGSAYHVALNFKYMAEEITKVPVEADLASEFRYKELLPQKNALCLVISQSGETADTAAAMRIAKSRGIKTVGIVNVKNSLIARECDALLPTIAGREIAVATTKAYSAQSLVAAILAVAMGKSKGVLSKKEASDYYEELKKLPQKAEEVLKNADRYKALAKECLPYKDFFFIGRNVDYALSLEASLKLKEITYLHAEGYAAGELKHGTISLINENVACFATATKKALFEKTLSNGMEVKTRGGKLYLLTNIEAPDVESDVTVLDIPKTCEQFSPILSVIPYQLFSYYLAVCLKKDVDKPQNLAKSVTVE